MKDLCKLHQQCLDLISPGQGCTVQLHEGLLVGNAVLGKHVHWTLRLTRAVRAHRGLTQGLYHVWETFILTLLSYSAVAQLSQQHIKPSPHSHVTHYSAESYWTHACPFINIHKKWKAFHFLFLKHLTIFKLTGWIFLFEDN